MIIVVTVHYEMYDGVPVLSKWVSITGSTSTMVSVYSVEFLALNQPWSVGGLETDTITGETDSGKFFSHCIYFSRKWYSVISYGKENLVHQKSCNKSVNLLGD